MSGRMNLHLTFDRFKINVSATIQFATPYSGAFAFSLNELLTIDSITAGNRAFSWSKNNLDLMFRAGANKYYVQVNEEVRELVISYHGKVTGFHTVLSENIASFNPYSVWYPQQLSVSNDEIAVTISGAEKYHVLKSSFQFGKWEFRGKSTDCNIIALKGYLKSTGKYSDVYYYGSNLTSQGEQYCKLFDSIVAYFHKLFGERAIGKFDVVIFPFGNPKDGYCRKELIVLDGFSEKEDRVARLFAHELGRLWCGDIDRSSGDDWQRETFSEWLSLLYLIDTYGKSVFEKRMKYHLKRDKDLPPIQEVDGSRPPAGIHTKGVLLLYDVYLKYGREIILEMIRFYVTRPRKDTEDMLLRISKYTGKNIAEIFREKIFQ